MFTIDEDVQRALENSQLRARQDRILSLIGGVNNGNEQLNTSHFTKGSHTDYPKGASLPLASIGPLGYGAQARVDQVCLTTQVDEKRYARKVWTSCGKATRTRFQRELQLLRRLNDHNHVVEILATYTRGSELGLLMSPVADHDLWTVLEMPELERRAVISDVQLTRALGCLITGLAFIHNSHIRHQDIKPRNILIHKGKFLFADFGLAKDLTGASASITDGSIAGTPNYRAPELNTWDPRGRAADVFSLGCVLMEVWSALNGYGCDREDSDSFSSLVPFSLQIPSIQWWITDKKTKSNGVPQALRLLWLNSCGDMLMETPGDRPRMTQVLHSLQATIDLESTMFCKSCVENNRSTARYSHASGESPSIASKNKWATGSEVSSGIQDIPVLPPSPTMKGTPAMRGTPTTREAPTVQETKTMSKLPTLREILTKRRISITKETSNGREKWLPAFSKTLPSSQLFYWSAINSAISLTMRYALTLMLSCAAYILVLLALSALLQSPTITDVSSVLEDHGLDLSAFNISDQSTAEILTDSILLYIARSPYRSAEEGAIRVLSLADLAFPHIYTESPSDLENKFCKKILSEYDGAKDEECSFSRYTAYGYLTAVAVSARGWKMWGATVGKDKSPYQIAMEKFHAELESAGDVSVQLPAPDIYTDSPSNLAKYFCEQLLNNLSGSRGGECTFSTYNLGYLTLVTVSARGSEAWGITVGKDKPHEQNGNKWVLEDTPYMTL